MPRNKFYKETISALLAKADVLVGGERPWDMRVNDENVYAHIFNKGSLGLGESYMAGMWDCNAIDQMIYRLIVSGAEKHVKVDARAVWYKLQAKFWNKQSVKRSLSSIHRHYDIGNDLFEAMLDKRMMYSSAYWKDAATLEEAQDNKLDLVCRKLYLEKGQRVLDIGCGWGGFAGFAAERYGVKVVGITLSGEQLKIARERYGHLSVEIRLQDYRNIDEKFD
ncbi:MAG TPA: class I SAM-dependent methyltransferase, partial [Mucilaginibacter sp.]|nr:class I SAM-dependent methyltransferase [Mucilaginibacter sp.]